MGGRWTGTPETYSKTLGISLSLDGWGCAGKRPTDLSTIPIPLESGRSWWTLEFPFWTFLRVEKYWACLGLWLVSTFGEAWVLGTGDCKTWEILHFPPFQLRTLTEETGYNRLELGLFEGPCILIESEEIWLSLVLRGMAVHSHWW